MAAPVRIGVSSCLLGERCRYDGGHRRDPNVADGLGRRFTLVPVCPEAGCGLPTPREPMRLEGDPADPRLVTVTTRADHTDRMRVFCRAKVRELGAEGVRGFVLKARSPSCGPAGVAVSRDGGVAGTAGGLFAAAVVRAFPGVPVEDEARLADPAVRREFVRRLLA